MAVLSFQFLDVGMGDGTLVQMWSGDDTDSPCELALVDFGEKRTPSKIPYGDAMTYLVDFIDGNSHDRNLHVPYVDVLFLTHPDGDHYNKVEELTNKAFPNFPGERLNFGRVVFGGNESNYGKFITELYDGGAGVVDKKPMPLGDKQHAKDASTLSPVPDWTFAGGNVKVYLLSSNYPSRGASAANPKSLVLLFQCGDKKVILQGDAEADVERYIRNEFDHRFLRSTALKLGHHGSKGASSPLWLDAVQPRAVFASGDMCWAHPYAEVICRVRDEHCLRPGITGFDAVWYCSGAGHGQNREYWNNRTTEAICLNLWYVVKADQEDLLYDGDGDGQNWSSVTGTRGATWGVQWELELPAADDPDFGLTPRAVPATGKSPTPAFDCSNLRGEFAFVPSPEPLGTP
jgi:competence protein ComEC